MIDNSDYLDPDSFSSTLRIKNEERLFPLTMELTASEFTRLSITLTESAQRYEFQARNREAKANGHRAPGILTIHLRERADEARSLLNAYREAAGLTTMSADDIMAW